MINTNYTNKINVLNYGEVELLDIMGNDNSPAESARVSYSSNKDKQTSNNEQLTRYLLRHLHMTPFEMIETKWRLKMPIFVARQHIRHRASCLSGDTILDFQLGGNSEYIAKSSRNTRYKLTIKEVYDRWTFGLFGNYREDLDLSHIDPDKYYTANSIGPWFIGRKSIAKSLGLNKKMKATNHKVVDHYKGSDILQFYEQQKLEGENHHKVILKQMFLRSLNEETGEIYHTHISDIWKSGQKQVIEVNIEHNNQQLSKKIKASEDHLFFTEYGWKKLKDIAVGDRVWTATASHQTPVDYVVPEVGEDEVWKPCYGYEDVYLISSYGRVQRIGEAKNATVGLIKSPTFSEGKWVPKGKGRYVIGLSVNGKTKVYSIHRLVLLSFLGKSIDSTKTLCCHKNGNPLDNRIDNLYWGSDQDNSDDSGRHGTRTNLKSKLLAITSKTVVGVEETYDIEVTGPFHNFSANSFIVHNSTNETSYRYSVVKDEFYIPNTIRLQSETNNQGSSFKVSANESMIKNKLLKQISSDYELYNELIHENVSRELARTILPVATYTEMIWKIDLRNMFNYLVLRMHSHAQEEIRVYADAMYTILKQYLPMCLTAFDDYILNARTFSKQELDVLVSAVDKTKFNNIIDESRLSIRERNEFIEKLK